MSEEHVRRIWDASRNIKYYHWEYVYLKNQLIETIDTTVILFLLETTLIVNNKYMKKWIKQDRDPFSM